MSDNIMYFIQTLTIFLQSRNALIAIDPEHKLQPMAYLNQVITMQHTQLLLFVPF